MGRPREHGDETRTALLSAAVKILEREGVGGVGVRRLADEIGASTRSVYSALGSKEAVFNALYRESFRRLHERLEAIPARADPVEQLVDAGVIGFRGYALEHPNLFRLAFERLIPDLNPTEADLSVALRSLDHLRDLVRRCIEQGRIVDRPVDPATIQFHAACQGLASVELNGWLEPTGDPAGCWSDTLRSLLRGYAEPVLRRASEPRLAGGARSTPAAPRRGTRA